MSSFPLIAPLLEPITLSDAKDHLRVDSDIDDGLINRLIRAARMHIEQVTSRALITQSWRIKHDSWPQEKLRGDRRIIDLPIGPIQQVTEIRFRGPNDVTIALDPSAYLVDATGTPARIALRRALGPHNTASFANIEIDVIAGYGDQPEDVPAPLRQALLMLVAHWYAEREPVSLGNNGIKVPMSADAILAPYRRRRI